MTNDEGGKVEFKFYRIGGASVEMLTLKPAERLLEPPGLSMLRADSPQAAAALMRAAFGARSSMGRLAAKVGEVTLGGVQAAGFDLLANPTNKFGDAHFRLVHPQGVAGFGSENLLELSNAFAKIDEL